ncbi:MAG: type II toxin-antitoxin system HicA family toxin [Rickettsia endosymbiont of Ixodes ricinus]|uniref:Type II toxin-antitoxin system HicA family toxin n=2 Tax=Rickettsia helvetica TaxID=35789 RepID=A0ABM9NA44_RICHE|nr:type II toxin-antitoxin system HicA family toxin [Rickettsia helvetica]MCZ6884366.1 type II toxin-antitoxin system HicA family toxin [Rickettsia endosymbiont of Ixodes ricinus]MCZ6896465.1 type II toxin-antitoxin system HicA family toxin [Rickettsia endosymbiont of Ixodes ricinus]
MNQYIKLINKAKQNPKGLSFSEFHTLMTKCGWVKDRQKGSHQIWYSPKGDRLSIQTFGSMAKEYQVRQFLNFEKGNEDEHK